MQAEVREAGHLRRELAVELDAQEVNRFIDGMIGAFRRRYTLPGFRPGKAPDAVIQARFQDEIERAVLSELVPDAIRRAFEEHAVHPASPPQVSQLRYRPREPLTFTVRVDVWPTVALKDYAGLKVEQVVEEVTESEVDRFLATMQERVAETVPVERESQAGDLVEAEIETIDAQGRPVAGTEKETIVMEAGGANLLPEFRAVSVGLAAGKPRELEVRYPEAFNDEALRGELRHYRLTPKRIQEKKPPPLDDQFAKRFDPNLDLDGLRARVRLRLESERRLQARERLEETVVERLIAENPFELPATAVEGALARIKERLREEDRPLPSDAEIESAYRPRIERFQRRDFLLEKVAEREGVAVTAEDVEAEVARMAREEKRSVEDVRKDLGDPERFRQFLFERRVFDALLPKLEVREVKRKSSQLVDPSGRPVASETVVESGEAGKESS